MSTLSGPVRILHVDDEPDLAEMVAEFVEREAEELSVETVTSVDDGLDRLADTRYECIVSDFEMPGWDGIEFLRAVRADHPELPFILYTGKGSEEVASDAISAGVTDYLQKGTGSDQYALLVNRIRNAVGSHRATESVRETEEWVTTLLEHSSDFLFVVDPTGTTSYVSPSVQRVLGYDPAEITGTSAFDFIHPDDLETAAQTFAETLDQPDEEVTTEFRGQDADGEHRWLEVRGRNLLDDPIVEGILVNARDITGRREQAAELQRIRERMEFALETTDSVIFELDYETDTETRHGPFERIYGLPNDEALTSKRFYERAVHPDDRDLVESQQSEIVEHRTDAVEVEYRTHPDRGDVEWIRTSMAQVPGGEGADSLIGLSTVITPLKEREADLEGQNDRLEEFASFLSHDLRNPLNVAEGRLALAREEHDSENLAAVGRGHDRMRSLIEDLLMMARRPESAGGNESVKLADVAERCWLDLQTETATLRTETDGSIRAEPTQLQQLLENLIGNAIRHGGDGVTVTVGTMDDGFFVEDDGPGVPAAERERIFDDGYTTVTEGTGLGLSIVRTVADAHGWELGATDGREGGARFEIRGVESA
ncbi:MAG: PAS domain S-box protein [Halobacteriales archaeon]|nr:PAS domain S-box protein [Halobacteriales archaeon]